jgi:hypothetical protein
MFFTCFASQLLGPKAVRAGEYLYYNTFYFSSDRPWNHWNSVKKHWKFTEKHWIFSVQCSPQIFFLKKPWTAFWRHWISVIFSDFPWFFSDFPCRRRSRFQCFSVFFSDLWRHWAVNSVKFSEPVNFTDNVRKNNWKSLNSLKFSEKTLKIHWKTLNFQCSVVPTEFFFNTVAPRGGV